MPWQLFINASEQVCIRWRRTGACYTDKLTFCPRFFHQSLGCVFAYYTNMRIIFTFLRYSMYCSHGTYQQLKTDNVSMLFHVHVPHKYDPI